MNSETLWFSHKALIEAELEQQKKDIISKLEKDRFSKEQLKHHLLWCIHHDLGGVWF